MARSLLSQLAPQRTTIVHQHPEEGCVPYKLTEYAGRKGGGLGL